MKNKTNHPLIVAKAFGKLFDQRSPNFANFVKRDFKLFQSIVRHEINFNNTTLILGCIQTLFDTKLD